MTFGQLLKQARKSQMKTLREVAEEAGLSLSYISDIEHGRRRPPDLEIVKQIEKFLNVEDALLVKAAKRRSNLPTEARKIFMQRPELNFALLRASENLSEDAITRLINQITKRGN